MTPGSLILLHSPGATAAAWGDLPELLRTFGLDVIAPGIREPAGMRYVARASLVIAAAGPTVPLVLGGRGAAGPLLPAIAAAQRAAHRPVGGYVFLDADLPVHRETEVPVPADWPEAPCGYLNTEQDQPSPVRQARLRGWPIRSLKGSDGPALAQALNELIAAM